MQRNFILTDLMKTGDHLKLEQFINLHSFPDQIFEMTGEYYALHDYDLDSYDRKFAVIHTNSLPYYKVLSSNNEFVSELKRRCDLLHSQGFVLIKANPWESVENIRKTTQYPQIDIEHVKWTGGTSWFWFYMYVKHKDSNFNFDHSNKKYDFLYLNKAPRTHRVKLYNKLTDSKILDNSLYSFTLLDKPVRLAKEYELPDVDPDDYPRFGKDQDIYEPPYNDTACSIVAETNINDYDIFMTEKIWKPIIAQQFFIVHGNYLYMQKLREMGFKTFNNYFEETYDLDRDPEVRINTIVDLCDRLRDAPWQDMYLQSQALRKYNFDHFFNEQKLSIEVNKTLNLFLEFADRS